MNEDMDRFGWALIGIAVVLCWGGARLIFMMMGWMQ